MILTTFVVLLIARWYYRSRSGRCNSKERLAGKTVIVTGASSGIGKEAAREFASRGARVILACRNLIKARKVAAEIIGHTGNKDVFVEYLDTSNLDSVRLFCRQILRNEEHLHILVNNAGIVGPQAKQVTKDGLELTMATNHYGHFLLTNLLLDRMIASGPGRIINVSSGIHVIARKINLRDLNFLASNYSPTSAYAQSKLCNILFTKELAEKLEGTEVTANSLHPGAVGTDFFRKGEFQQTWYARVVNGVLSFVVHFAGKTSELGAQTTIYLAVSKDVEKVSGRYFEDCKLSSSSWLAQDRRVAKALWEVSEADVQLRPREEHY
ncbi:retinol dehydrogenase 13-like isoform X1 [Macrobrachium nipponense]|uniref:retinol dehydrogenase 13-like isoform X1 n=1 Tax=Macrobrachium nipponense TaxID=159736 RepID=UPI0030C8BF08